jgi:hypothetical protein
MPKDFFTTQKKFNTVSKLTFKLGERGRRTIMNYRKPKIFNPSESRENPIFSLAHLTNTQICWFGCSNGAKKKKNKVQVGSKL